MAQKVVWYMCMGCKHQQRTDFETCPACGCSQNIMRTDTHRTDWVYKGSGMFGPKGDGEDGLSV